jgi:hypothetical protein
MQKTVTGTTMMMTRASGSTTPRWTLTMVVVVVKASINPLNATLLRARSLYHGTESSRRLLLLLGHQRFETLEDVRDREVLGEQVLLNLLGLLQHRLGIFVRVFGALVGGCSVRR